MLAGGTKGVPGRIYTFVATPQAGSIFVGWQTAAGILLSSGRTLRLTVQNDLELVARFIANPFPERAGVYVGLATVGNASLRTRALCQVTLSKSGSYTGTLSLAEGRFALKGAFDGSGNALSSIARKGALPIAYALQLNLSTNTGVLIGNITIDEQTLALRAERGAAASIAATYTLSLPADAMHASDPKFPHGTGWARATLAANAAISCSGVLGDGTAFSQNVKLSQSGAWPFFALPYGKAGLVGGRLTFHPGAVAGGPGYVDGALSWVKSETLEPIPYRADFTGTIIAVGSQYLLRPNKRSLDVGAAVNLTIAGGSIATPITDQLTYSLDDHFAISPNPHAIALSISSAKGTFSGSFLDGSVTPAKTRKVSGVLLQYQKRAVGLFTSETGSGSVLSKSRFIDPVQLDHSCRRRRREQPS